MMPMLPGFLFEQFMRAYFFLLSERNFATTALANFEPRRNTGAFLQIWA
jgi:hypothetical protein